MREGYTYDDEMPSSQGSYVNRGHRRKGFTGLRIGTIRVNPDTKDIEIIRDEENTTDQEKGPVTSTE